MKWYEQLGMYTILGVATHITFKILVSLRAKIDEDSNN